MDANRFLFIPVAVAALGAGGTASGQASADDPGRAHVDLFRRAAPAVVALESLGSGVFIDPGGLILTSTSGVPPRERVTVHLHDGRRVEGRVVGRSPAHETALVRVEDPAAGPFAFLPFVEEEPSVGRVVYTLGNAFQSLSRDGQVSMSVGVVSGAYVLATVHKRARATYTGRVLETTAAVNPGMSGAPVVDREGRLVGMVTMNLDEGRWLGAAIPAPALRPVVEDLKAGRAPPAPPAAAFDAESPASGGWLGVEAEDAPDGGLLVIRIETGSPADRVDLRVGDRIMEVNGEAVGGLEDFRRVMEGTSPGDRIQITLERGTKTMQKKVELGNPKPQIPNPK
jgi:serine protease Do